MMIKILVATSLLALPSLALPWIRENPTATPGPCASSATLDRPTLGDFHDAVRGMCHTLMPDDIKVKPPIHTTIFFDIQQPDNQPPKHVVASVDIKEWGPINAFSCENAWGATSNVVGPTLDKQIDKGNICMKEGGKVRDDWLVVGWEAMHWVNHHEVKFE
jgi:hypothetical protein